MKNNKDYALVICSGGLDSTVALYDALHKYGKVAAVTFAYGQNHQRREGAAVVSVCKTAHVSLTRINLGFIGQYFKSSLLGGNIPNGHYAAKNMASTVVPYRNGIMLSVAAGLAQSMGCDRILIGNHAGDHFIYPDCRPEFIMEISAAIKAGTGNRLIVESPFCNMTKADIVRIGNRLNVPFGMTYSCYKGGRIHCGKCGTCVERKEAFEIAGVADPTVYEA